jgi:hypothetical protein
VIRVPVALADPEKDLAELNRFAVFGNDFDNLTRYFSLDLVHDFHRLDNADN